MKTDAVSFQMHLFSFTLVRFGSSSCSYSWVFLILFLEAHSEPSQTSKISLKLPSLIFDWLLNISLVLWFQLFHSMCLALYQVVTELRKNFNKGILRDVESRLRILKQFNTMIDECEDEICEAIYKDLRKVSATYLNNSSSIMFSTYNLVAFKLHGERELVFVAG